MLTPTHDEVVEAIEAAVQAAGPDFTYRSLPGPDDTAKCWYVYGGQPSCLVGQVLHRLGVSVEMLSTLEDRSVRAAVRVLADHGVLTLSSETIIALRVAQAKQDGGSSWGEALRAFHHQYNM